MNRKEALLLSSGNGPGECRQAVGHLLSWLATKAPHYDVELDVSTRDAAHGPASAVVILNGARADELARSVEGVILWRCQSALRPRHKRKNWFVQVFRLPRSHTRCRLTPQPLRCRPFVPVVPAASTRTRPRVRSGLGRPVRMCGSTPSTCVTTAHNIRTVVWR